ncbi:hypothetical protein ACGFIG_22440 [Micromonospora sp. NPDC049048]|uniref:hypothetical protein n=1 Tax=Micromonospora sp. NPDC049048 TaxID=3364263 RepID=UPI003710FE64
MSAPSSPRGPMSPVPLGRELLTPLAACANCSLADHVRQLLTPLTARGVSCSLRWPAR